MGRKKAYDFINVMFEPSICKKESYGPITVVWSKYVQKRIYVRIYVQMGFENHFQKYLERLGFVW